MQIHRRPAVQKRTGLCRSGIYKLMAAGDFPLPVQLSAKAVGWIESDVDAWIASRPVAGPAVKS